jgi:hypothetical protein
VVFRLEIPVLVVLREISRNQLGFVADHLSLTFLNANDDRTVLLSTSDRVLKAHIPLRGRRIRLSEFGTEELVADG